MKILLPLFASAIILAGCADDNGSNPWATDTEKADAGVKSAVASDSTAEASRPRTAPVKRGQYSWEKKKAAEAAAEAAKPAEAIEAGHASITAIRGDAGLIALKRAEASAPGDKLVLKKDGKNLLVVVSSVDGEAVIADITANQVDALAPKVGDVVTVAAFEEASK